MKLRDDITVKEAVAWAKAEYGQTWSEVASRLLSVAQGCEADYPAHFYEQPPVGSFGYTKIDIYGVPVFTVWGYLAEYDPTSNAPYTVGGHQSNTFTPGLPTDVDADGMPKEVAE